MPKIMGNSLAEHRERTRNALFEALSALMNHRSFDKITLSDVAAHAGVGRTAVYNHFANKEDPIDRLRVYVRQQALIKRHYHFPSTGPLANSVSRGTASRLRSHAGLMTQMLAQILTDAMNCGAIPRQDPSQMIPLVHACVMGGRPTPSEPRARAQYLAALDTFVLRAVGAPDPHHEVPAIPPTRASDPAHSDREHGRENIAAAG